MIDGWDVAEVFDRLIEEHAAAHLKILRGEAVPDPGEFALEGGERGAVLGQLGFILCLAGGAWLEMQEDLARQDGRPPLTESDRLRVLNDWALATRIAAHSACEGLGKRPGSIRPLKAHLFGLVCGRLGVSRGRAMEEIAEGMGISRATAYRIMSRKTFR